MTQKESFTTLVSPETAQENTARFKYLLTLEHELKEAPDDPLYEEWTEFIPQSEFGELSLRSAFGSFTAGYKEALKQGTVKDYVADQVASIGYERIYRVRANPDYDGPEDDKKIVAQHAPLFLADVAQKLDEFEERVNNAPVPQIYKNEYVGLIEDERRYIRSAQKLATPEFTNLQKTPTQWGKFIDIEKSKQEGTVVLPFENEAIQVIERSRLLPKRDIKVKDALDLWELSDAEKEAIGYFEIDEDAKELTPNQGAKLIAVLLNRLDHTDWKIKIDKNTAAVTVKPKERLIYFPILRKFKGMEVIFIPSHEIMHALRGKNGAKQGLGLFKEGVNDNETTEEGVGAVAEMVMGEPFGDPRQAMFAARYLATAMSLKADVADDGTIRPRYSPQEIYDKLCGYGIDEDDSGNIVWRLMRGTSLYHKPTFINVASEEGSFTLPAAECHTKDTVYFEGQMEVFQWIKDHMPLDPNVRMKEALTLGSEDFSTNLLARVGLSREHIELDVNHSEPILTLKKRYNSLVKLGRQTLIDILNIHGAGKMRLDFLEDDSEWYDLLKFGSANGMLDYGNILKPRDSIDVESFIKNDEN